jgi:hypothetical protein
MMAFCSLGCTVGLRLKKTMHVLMNSSNSAVYNIESATTCYYPLVATIAGISNRDTGYQGFSGSSIY